MKANVACRTAASGVSKRGGLRRRTRRGQDHIRGLSVTFLGPDGSGKSTMAKALAESLGQEMFHGVDYYHANFGVLPELKSFKRLFAALLRRNGRQSEPAAVDWAVADPRNPWLSLIYLLYYSIDYALGGWIMKRVAATGRLVILDRCIYDYYLQRHNRRLPPWLLRTIVRLLPKPDLVAFLEGDPEVIHRRKPELSVEEIQNQIDIIKKLGTWMPNAVRVRTDRPVTDALADIEAHVRNVLLDRQGGGRS